MLSVETKTKKKTKISKNNSHRKKKNELKFNKYNIRVVDGY